jgi:hypothetical protein
MRKKEMTPTLGFRFGKFISKRSLLLSVLKLKNNFKNLKIIFKQTLIVPTRNCTALLLPPNPFF